MASQAKNFKVLFRYQTVPEYIFFLYHKEKVRNRSGLMKRTIIYWAILFIASLLLWVWLVLSVDSKCSAELYPEPVLAA